jgi:hypothetical protein
VQQARAQGSGNCYLMITAHFPFVHVPEQQSADDVHVWPIGMHSTVLGVHDPATQTPSQQSASAVHAPFRGTHVAVHTMPPLPSGRQIFPQHSSAKLQDCPSATHVVFVPGPKHRLTPIRVTRHSLFPPSDPFGQQLADWPIQQTSPAGMQPAGFTQRLTGVPSQMSPQQSALVRQISPCGLHPLTNWHTGTPVPGSAQMPEQHSWNPVQGSPAVWHSAITGHNPSVPHTPLQQSPGVVHTSPPPRQLDTTTHLCVPETSAHFPEQHAASFAQASPATLQLEPDGSHVPEVPQAFEQQSAFAAHGCPLIAQAASELQSPLLQDNPQQSTAAVHGCPTPAHPPG